MSTLSDVPQPFYLYPTEPEVDDVDEDRWAADCCEYCGHNDHKVAKCPVKVPEKYWLLEPPPFEEAA